MGHFPLKTKTTTTTTKWVKNTGNCLLVKNKLIVFNFWVGVTLLSLDFGPMGGSNLKALY